MKNKEQTAFKVHITEVFGRNVIVYADNKEHACEIAEELCNEGIIDLDSNLDFGSRNVEVIGVPDDDDMECLSRFIDHED